MRVPAPMLWPIFSLLFLARLAVAESIDSVAKLRSLSFEEADSHLPVSIEGVVIYFDPKKYPDLFVQDPTGATFVENCPSGVKVHVGDRVRVKGRSGGGGYFPVLKVSGGNAIKVLGTGPLPEPRVIQGEELFLPEVTGQWVEVSAIVTGVETGGIGFTLAIEMNGWKLKAEIPKTQDSQKRAAELMQRFVRIRGVVGTVFNPDHQMTGRFIFVPSFDFITPISPIENLEEQAPLRSANELLRRQEHFENRVRVQGIVLQAEQDGFYLRDKTACIRVVTADTFQRGEKVEVEGVPAIAPFRPILRATRVSVLERAEPPAPIPLDLTRKDLFPFHGALVTVDADFLVGHDDLVKNILECAAGGRIIEVDQPLPGSLPQDLKAGDRLRLTGICELTTTHPTPRIQWVDGLRLHLSETGGIEIIRHASWWTIRHLMISLGIVSGIAIVALLWVRMLRRIVNEQTEALGVKIKREGVLEERNRIARELHDTVEQELTGLSMQFGNIAHQLHDVPPLLGEEFRFAQQMLRHCRDEARTSIWDLRNFELEQRGIAGALEARIDMLSNPEGVVVGIQVLGNPYPLGALIENNLLRLAQEAVNNALRHASAQKIQVLIYYQIDSVNLEIIDDGCGFDISKSAPPGHFGLHGMRERADKLQARISIESIPSVGTTIRVVIPQKT